MVKEEFGEDQSSYSWYDGFEEQKLDQEIKPGTKRPWTKTKERGEEGTRDLQEGKERKGEVLEIDGMYWP